MPRLSVSVTLTSLAVAALAASSPNPSFAVAEDGSFAARGIGAQSCENLTTVLTGDNQDMASIQLGAWVAGYLSHANRVAPETYDIMPIQNIYGVATILARICDRNPQSLVEPVMNRIVAMMDEYSQPVASPLSVVENDGAEVAIRQAVLANAQRILIANGYLETGNDDGVYGPKTREAIIEFQKSNSLEGNGLPDALTLFVLFDAE